jgi:hypothetical protein
MKKRKRIAAMIVGTAFAGGMALSNMHISKAYASTKAPVSIRRNLQTFKTHKNAFVNHKIRFHKLNK